MLERPSFPFGDGIFEKVLLLMADEILHQLMLVVGHPHFFNQGGFRISEPSTCGVFFSSLKLTGIAPTNGWLECYFPIREAYFQGPGSRGAGFLDESKLAGFSSWPRHVQGCPGFRVPQRWGKGGWDAQRLNVCGIYLFTYICPLNCPNVGKYTIHSLFGMVDFHIGKRKMLPPHGGILYGRKWVFQK